MGLTVLESPWWSCHIGRMALKSESEWTMALRLVGGKAGTKSAVWQWEVYEPKKPLAVAKGTVEGAEHKARKAGQNALWKLEAQAASREQS